MPRGARTRRSRVVSTTLLVAALLSACTGGQTGSEGARHLGRGMPVTCSSSADAGLQASYDFAPEDVLEIARGTWTGRYPGGAFTGPFDITVTVEDLEPGDYVHPDDGVQYFQPHAVDPGAEITDDYREGCVSMAVPALVHVEASEPLFSLDRDFRHVVVRGTSLLAQPFEGRGVEVRQPVGAVTAGREFNGPQSVEIEYHFVFGSDGRLWVSVERDGTPVQFMESGRRE